jgi:hypothetical protein
MSPFVATLQDPENVTGVKWPGPTAVPTGTFQLSYDGTITTDANGNYAGLVGPQISAGTSNIGVLQAAASTTAGGNITWAAGPSTFFPSGASAGLIYDNFRVVSGCVKITYIGNTSTDAGLVTGWWDILNGIPSVANLITYGTQFVGSTSAVYSKAYSESWPLRNGLCNLWKPADYTDGAFQPSLAVLAVTQSSPVLGFLINGATPSTALARIRIVFNYEGIPTSDTADFVSSTTNLGDINAPMEAAMWGQTVLDKIRPMVGVFGDDRKKNANMASELGNNVARYRTMNNRPKKSGNSIVDAIVGDLGGLFM